jgi:integrase
MNEPSDPQSSQPIEPKRRRPAGTGSLRRRSRNSWELRVRRDDVAGEKGWATKTVRGDKKHAERELAKLVRAVQDGTYADDEGLTVGQLLDRWMAAQKLRVQASTFETYTSLVEHYVRPEIGAERLRDVRPSRIDQVIARWVTGTRKDKKKGSPSASTVNHALIVIKAAMRWAVRKRLIPTNPCEAVEPLKVNAKEITPPDAVGIAALLEAAKGTDLYVPIIVAVGTGLRRGEVLGLTRGDVDLDVGRLVVRRSLDDSNGTVAPKPPKTKNSARSVPLPGFVVDALMQQLSGQTARLQAKGIEPKSDTPLFDDGEGGWMNPNRLSKRFYALVRSAKLPKTLHFHGLRHAYATLLLACGTDLKTVSAALGHHSVKLTGDTYAHRVVELHQEAADRLDNLLGRALGAARTGSAAEASEQFVSNPSSPEVQATEASIDKARKI